MTSKKWYSRNNVLFSLVARGITIIAFILLFEKPEEAGIVMTASQLLYTIYVLIFIRYTKLRYAIIIAFSQILTIGIIVISFLGAAQALESSLRDSLNIGYIVLFLSLVGLFLAATLLEIGIKKFVIAREWGRFYTRFIVCENDDQEKIFRYDENSQK